MATSGAMGTSNPYVKYTIDIRQNSQNVSANTSNITVSVRFYRTNTGYETWGSGTVWCRINGTTYSAQVTPNQKITSAGIVLFSKAVDIPHDSDGGKYVGASAWININSPLTSSEQTFGTNLTRIPRATVPSLSPSTQELGGRIQVSLPRASTSFTHNVRYTFGSVTETIATGATTSTSFVLPMSLASQIPNNVSGIGEVIVDTYNGGTFIGTAKATFTATIPNALAPVINNVNITDTNSVIASKFSALVSGKSKMKVSVSASGVQGSAISSTTIQYAGQTYSGSSVSDIPVIYTAKEVTVTVRDSRGNQTQKSYTINVLEYDPPQIYSFTVSRCNPYGTPDDEGENLLYQARFSISTCNNRNDKTYKIEYKKSTDERWRAATSGSTYEYNSSGTKTGNLFDVDYAYQVRLTVSDYFGSATAEVELPTAFTLIDYYRTGKGISFGGVADKDGFAVKMEAFMEENVLFEKGINVTGDDGKNIDIAAAFKNKYDWIYPVGIIVAFANNTDPNEAFKGTTWERTSSGRVLVGLDPYDSDFSQIGKTGGEKKHALSESEMPSHSHSLSDDASARSFAWGANLGTVHVKSDVYAGSTPSGSNYLYSRADVWQKTDRTGSTQPHNNLQPYKVVSYWQRIS